MGQFRRLLSGPPPKNQGTNDVSNSSSGQAKPNRGLRRSEGQLEESGLPWLSCRGYGTIAARTGVLMDDSPRDFVHELRSGILRKRVGQIALAVVLAEACIRFLNSLTWLLVVPGIAWLLRGHTESVLFRDKLVVPWEQLFGSLLEFILAIIFVFYVNRWIRGSLPKPSSPEAHVSTPPPHEQLQVNYNLVGQPLADRDTPEQ
jgi:large-conductance mechanosensitive channel